MNSESDQIKMSLGSKGFLGTAIQIKQWDEALGKHKSILLPPVVASLLAFVVIVSQSCWFSRLLVRLGRGGWEWDSLKHHRAPCFLCRFFFGINTPWIVTSLRLISRVLGKKRFVTIFASYFHCFYGSGRFLEFLTLSFWKSESLHEMV